MAETNEDKVKRRMPWKGVKNVKLLEGCYERIQAQKGVSLQRRDNTNKNLARVMAKTWSETQMVTRGHIGQVIWEGNTRRVF